MSCFLLLFMSSGFSGCNWISAGSPAKRYEHAQAELEEGDYVQAATDAERSRRQFANSESEWAWRFRVLEAEALVSRGLSADCITLLQPPVPASLAHSEIAVRKELFEGLANCFLRKFDEANRHISQAEQLAETDQPSLLGEVLVGRGTLAFIQGDLTGARADFHQALEFARQSHQSFVEARALGSLGLVAQQQEHYDESIDWYTQSISLSRTLGARAITAKTLGNMGWSYYRMGDGDEALALSMEAKNAAIELGVDKDEMLWLRNIGTIEGGRRSYSDAARDYLLALKLANKLENKAVAGECLHDLAIVEFEDGNYDDAARHVRQALELENASHDRPMELYSIMTRGYIEAGRKEYSRATSDLTEVINDQNSDTYLRWQAEVGLAKVYADEKRPAKAEQYFRRAMATIEAARSSIKREEFRLSYASGVVGSYDDHVSFLVSQRKLIEALEVGEISRAQTLAEGLGR